MVSAKRVILAATFIYGNEDVSVPLPATLASQEKCLARSEHGAWVKAWLYVPYAAIEDQNYGQSS